MGQKEAAPEVDLILQGGNGTSHHPGDGRGEFLKVVIDEGEEKKKGGKPEKSSRGAGSKKPPRHPRGPSLVAADRRFIEQMVLKRIESTERVKELSRRDAASSSSSSKESLLLLLVIIIVLCFLNLFRILEPWRRWSAGIIHA